MTLPGEATLETGGKACSSLGMMEDAAGHQHLFKHRKGSFVQKALKVWQGALQSVAFLLCNYYANKPAESSRLGTGILAFPRGALAETQPWGLQFCSAGSMLGLVVSRFIHLTVGEKMIL